MHKRKFQPGIDVLLFRHKSWLRGRRIGLVSHTAAVDSHGCMSSERLWRSSDVDLTCLMGPEHGFFGRAAAGASCRSTRHPDWRIPVYSLYGKTRQPTPRMLREVDTLVVDVQDIGARPYTYVSTLKLVIEAAASAGKEVVVADRPIPLPNTVDGPVVAEGFESFVSLIEAPMSYGMTPGETALWIKENSDLDVDLKIACMDGYHRDTARGQDWPPWIPPSPAMLSWESAKCFAATVCMEGLAALDHGRRTSLPFQVFGSRWTKGNDVSSALTARRLPGVHFYPHGYIPFPGKKRGDAINGVRMTISSPDRFRPILTAVTIIDVLQELYGTDRIWKGKGVREDFFDKLLGTDTVRSNLKKGKSARSISAEWTGDLARFRRSRKKHLLYDKGSAA